MSTLRTLRALTKPRWLLVAVIAAGVALAVAVGWVVNDRSAARTTALTHPVRREVDVRTTASTPSATLSASPPSAGCRVTYSVTTWAGQFEARVTIRNASDTTIDRWKLTFAFPGDQHISSGWNTSFTQTGATVSAVPGSYYEAAIAPGASETIGFLGTWTSDAAPPTSFRVNGMACR